MSLPGTAKGGDLVSPNGTSTTVQDGLLAANLTTLWLLIAAFLVFLMQVRVDRNQALQEALARHPESSPIMCRLPLVASPYWRLAACV